MKTMTERLKRRMRKDRPMTVISLRIPEDVIDDLKEIAPLLGFFGYQPLLRSYIGQGLRDDLSRLHNLPVEAIAEGLHQQGISEEIIAAVIADANLTPA